MIRMMIIILLFLSACEDRAEPFKKKEHQESIKQHETGKIETH